MLDTLKSRLAAYLPANNIVRLTTTWHPDQAGVSPESDPAYFQLFAQAFREQILSLFNVFYKVSTNITSSYFSRTEMSLGEELILQYKLRSSLGESFKNRDKLAREVVKYVKSADRQALIVHGDSGSGKSCLMAFIAANLVQFLPDFSKLTVLFRFMATTKMTSSLDSTYLSLIGQLRLAFADCIQRESAAASSSKDR